GSFDMRLGAMQRSPGNTNNQSDTAVREIINYIGQAWVLKQRVPRRDKKKVGCGKPENQSDQARTQAPKPKGHRYSAVKRDEWCVRSQNAIEKRSDSRRDGNARKRHSVAQPGRARARFLTIAHFTKLTAVPGHLIILVT